MSRMIYSWRTDRVSTDHLWLDTVLVPIVTGIVLYAWQYVWLKALGIPYPLPLLVCHIGIMTPGLLYDARYPLRWRALWFLMRLSGPVLLGTYYLQQQEWPSMFVLLLPALALAKSLKPSFFTQEVAILMGLAPLFWLLSIDLSIVPVACFILVAVVYAFLSIY